MVITRGTEHAKRMRQGCALPAQVLLAIYFFLAGCVVSQSRMLWVMPAASAVFACALALTAAASSALSSSYRRAHTSRTCAVPVRPGLDQPSCPG